MDETKEKSIVLTGATGFLGAFLMAGLLEQGYCITVLGRSSKEMTLPERLKLLIQWLGTDDPGERLLAVESDFSKNHLGLDSDAYDDICARARIIIHCASDTSFAERNRTRVMETNVAGLPALLELASDAGAGQMCYVSTAYAAGMCEGLCLETPAENPHYINVYEESKAQAERIIMSYCAEKNVPLSILRPSIVYGHSATGMALKFNALYYPVKSLLYIRDIYKKDIVEQGGERSRMWGVSLQDDGRLVLPLAVYLRKRGTLNLIPVDYFVGAALKVIESGAKGIFHITSDDPPDMSALLIYCERFLHVRGICAVYDKMGKNPSPNPAEELFDRFIEPYRPYMCDTRTFARENLKRIAPELAAPSFTYEIFERCMNYAVGCDWEKIVI